MNDHNQGRRSTCFNFGSPTGDELSITHPDRPCFGLHHTAWKYVDIEHAERIAAGDIRIGTLSSYANLENGRADAADGSLTMELNGYFDGTPVPRLESFLGRNPIGAFTGCVLVEMSWPGYAFCMSKPGTPFEHPEGVPQAIFEVRVQMLSSYLARFLGYAKRLEGIKSGVVEYRTRTINAMEADAEVADPFVKDTWFAHEREVRLFLKPLGFQDVSPFTTGPNVHLASCFRRLA